MVYKMRIRNVDGLVQFYPETLTYLRLLARLTHLAMVLAPGCILLLFDPAAAAARGQAGQLLLLAGALALLSFQALGVYGGGMFLRQLRLRPLAAACVLLFLVLWLARGLSPALAALPDRLWPVWFTATLALLLAQRLLVHIWCRRLVRRGVGLQRTVILGCTASGHLLAGFLKENADIRACVIGFVDDRSDRLQHAMAGLPYLGGMRRLETMVREGEVQQILVALPWAAVKRMGDLVSMLRRLPVTVLLAPDMAGLQHAHHRVTAVAGLPMFNISERPLKGWSPLLKRCEDVLLAVCALALTAPLMLLIALLIKLDSPGPVLFRQRRYGYNNRLIEVYKFRSMYVERTDADAEAQTTRSDPRVTRVGRFIRKTSLDELPQLLNVLGGSMSMVGPRPHATATKAAGVLFEDAVAEYSARHRVKPGITGWAQVNGYRGETDTLAKIEGRVAHDLEYIENWSLWFDAYILIRTLPAVLSADEAY